MSSMSYTNFLKSPYSNISDEIVHPSILSLKNGPYKFCIAYTPYPNSDFNLENPCVAFTNDFESFIYPNTNPIVPRPPHGYNADPELFTYQGGLYLMFRYRSFNGNDVIVYRYSLLDEWVKEDNLISGIFKSQDYASPSLVNYNSQFYLFSHNLDAVGWDLELRKFIKFKELKESSPIKLSYDLEIKYWHSCFRVFENNLLGIVQCASHTGGTGCLLLVKYISSTNKLEIIARSKKNWYYRSCFNWDDTDGSALIIISYFSDSWNYKYDKIIFSLSNLVNYFENDI